MSSAEAKPGSFVREVEIVNSRGLHARASAKFVQMAEKFDAEIRVSREGQTVPGTSIMGLMMLAAAPGCCIRIETEGTDAEAALETLAALVADGFGERD
ncbi:HPr family phosphocarrier protein [Parvibaculum sp.]|uniref:HPr family phosphocarrier protein n=1 Tax=Parvibaculum sp. TaxID=2024848 RepID=UPI002FD8B19F